MTLKPTVMLSLRIEPALMRAIQAIAKRNGSNITQATILILHKGLGKPEEK